MSSNERKQLNEVRLSWAGKLFFAGVAAKLAAAGLRKLGSLTEQEEETEKNDIAAMFPFKLQGTSEEIQAVVDVIKASKEYQEEISKEGATVESVMQKLNIQNIAKQAFEQVAGKPWPL